MANSTQVNAVGDVVLFEEDNLYSREKGTLLDGETVVVGTVLGQVTKAGASAAADAGNTGDGAMGAITVSQGAKAGVYRLTIIEPATDAGAFQVEDPDGVNIGSGNVGSAFSGGGLAFTLADGATDFVAGDAFDITVAAGSLKYVAYDEDGVDGSEIAAGIALEAAAPSGADRAITVLVRHARVKKDGLAWPSSIEAGEITTGIGQLEALGIVVDKAA